VLESEEEVTRDEPEAEVKEEPVESNENNSSAEASANSNGNKHGELSVYRIEAPPGPDPKYFTSFMKFNFNKPTPPPAADPEGRQRCFCKSCGASFENAEEMWQHKLEKHAEGLHFLCDCCSYRTQSRLELQSHMLSTHGNEVGDMKEYMCFICSKGYSSKRGLNNHLMRHSEEGPPGFDCQEPGCKSRLVSKSALKNHIRRVHTKRSEDAGEQVFLCDFKGCDKTFKETKHLKVHRMQHTDERPLKCELCFYSCRQRNSMNWHMKSKHNMDKHVTSDGRTFYLQSGSFD
jgi:KRAB domain-containing zinc finger protein